MKNKKIRIFIIPLKLLLKSNMDDLSETLNYIDRNEFDLDFYGSMQNF